MIAAKYYLTTKEERRERKRKIEMKNVQNLNKKSFIFIEIGRNVIFLSPTQLHARS